MEVSDREAKLLIELQESRKQVVDRDRRIEELTSEVKLLQGKLDALIKRLFGAKSEKIDASQLLFLLQGGEEPGKSSEPEAAAESPRCPEEESTPKATKKQRRKRPRTPPNIKVVETVMVPEEVQAEPEAWRQIDQEVSKRLDYEPAQFIELRTVRPKYVRRDDRDQAPIIAELPPSLLERSEVGPGLLSQIIVAKYCDHLPLYRQESIYWTRHQVWLPRQTLCDWIELGAQWLKPVYEEIRQEIFSSGYVQLDETAVRYLAPGSKRAPMGYFWVAAEPKGDAVFQWHPSRAAECLQQVIPEDFRGIVQRDGYEAYKCMERERAGAVKLAGCMAHVRRKFREAEGQAPRIAGWFARQFQNLYRIEENLRVSRAGPHLREAVRASQSRMILKRLHRVLLHLEDKRRYLPQSQMGKAITYTLRQWEGLLVYLEKGRIEIDNNRVENAIRPTAVGKKNWLFIGAEDAGERSAILYTVIEACRRRSIDPFEYLRDVFTRLPSMTNWQIKEITPAAWAKDKIAKAPVALAA